MNSIQTLQPLIEGLLRQAGETVRTAFFAEHRSGYTLKGRQDYLTETDGTVELLIKQGLSVIAPGDAFFGEETGGNSQASRLWIADPIDGTANFARGLPHFCISLARLTDGVPDLAFVYDPVHDEMFTAAADQAARCNGRVMQVSAIDALAQASIELGWSTRRPTQAYSDLHSRLLMQGCSVRRAGSAALGLAHVAAGRSDAYLELHVNAWDIAAGWLLVRQAGGFVNPFWSPGAIASGNPIFACNAALPVALDPLFAH